MKPTAVLLAAGMVALVFALSGAGQTVGLPDAPSREAYAANEVAINWNAPLVFLLAGVLK